jgi:hypothetical protein
MFHAIPTQKSDSKPRPPVLRWDTAEDHILVTAKDADASTFTQLPCPVGDSNQ